MTLGDTPGAAEGSIAPAGGCPGNFFTSRKWTYEHDMLIIRDHKGELLVELAFANGRFEGKTTNGAAGLARRDYGSRASWPNINSTASPSPAMPIARR